MRRSKGFFDSGPAQSRPASLRMTANNFIVETKTLTVDSEHSGRRLDHFLVSQLPDNSRSWIQQLISQKKVLVDGKPAKASLPLRGGERIEIVGEVERPPLRAIAEEIPLDVIYEDDDLAVVNKPAGMMVHAGAGGTDEERNRGTLVNALLHRFGALSGVGGELRPGIVHRLDKDTSGLIVVAKNDTAHRKLGAEFSGRRVKKTYIALVHGWLKDDHGTISSPISRDAIRRIRMTTRRSGGREAVTKYVVERRIQSEFGKFTLVKVKIETGRTHQIRVHMASLGHPVAGDALYGAPREIRAKSGAVISLPRNFLHSAELQFEHPHSGELLSFSSPIPEPLVEFLRDLELNRAMEKRL
ncbi:MAG: ribosomal large subunit pseudouridine synthase [Acidobacteriaceae bacterium]|nr:ribosomal large subunit pseudouridine synthase [Acidobacteriaceae bacterium]